MNTEIKESTPNDEDVVKYFAIDPQEYADHNGLIIVEPKSNQLQLDIDSPDKPEEYDSLMSILEQGVGITEEKETISRSGNKHIYITLDRPLSHYERIALQACLGSDRKRELLTWLNYQNPVNSLPQFLYEKKESTE